MVLQRPLLAGLLQNSDVDHGSGIVRLHGDRLLVELRRVNFGAHKFRRVNFGAHTARDWGHTPKRGGIHYVHIENKVSARDE
jgi:hypothetical protein